MSLSTLGANMPSPRAPTPGLFLALLLLIPFPTSAQELLDQITALGTENAQAYSAPLTEGLTHTLTGGFMDRSAPLGAMRFDLGVRFLGAIPSGEGRTFRAIIPDEIHLEEDRFVQPYRPRDGSLDTPTISGEGDGIVLVPDGDFRDALLAAGEDPGDYQIPLPPGLSLPLTPLLAVHASIGVGLGTEISLRFLPAFEATPELGGLRSHGLSVSHELSHWFSSPLDLSAHLGYQEATAEDFLQASAVHYGLLAGVNAGPMNFFGGTMLRRGTTTVDYRISNPTGTPGLPQDGVQLSFDSELSTTPGYVLGARLQLLVMNLAGHYTFGDQDVFSLKLGIGLP
jgi:hypothetical protein